MPLFKLFTSLQREPLVSLLIDSSYNEADLSGVGVTPVENVVTLGWVFVVVPITP